MIKKSKFYQYKMTLLAALTVLFIMPAFVISQSYAFSGNLVIGNTVIDESVQMDEIMTQIYTLADQIGNEEGGTTANASSKKSCRCVITGTGQRHGRIVQADYANRNSCARLGRGSQIVCSSYCSVTCTFRGADRRYREVPLDGDDA